MPNGRRPDASVAEKRVSRPYPLVLRLAVVVREVLEAGNQTEAAPVDLVRSRVVANVVWLSRSVGEKRHAALAGAEVVRDARARRPRDDVSCANRMLLALASVLRLRGRGPELERSLPCEDDEDLLVDRMAVRRRAGVAVVQASPVQTGAYGARPDRHPHPAARVAFVLRVDLVCVDDVDRTRRRRGKFRLAGGGFAVPRARALGDVERDAGVVTDDVRPQEVRVPRDDPFAEREHVEPVVACAQRVDVGDAVDDAIARTDLVRLVLLNRPARTGEHEEDLLRVELAVDGRRPASRLDLDAVHADALRAGRVAEIGPRAAHMSLLETVGLDVVPVRDHREPILCGRFRNAVKVDGTPSVCVYDPSEAAVQASRC